MDYIALLGLLFNFVGSFIFATTAFKNDKEIDKMARSIVIEPIALHPNLKDALIKDRESAKLGLYLLVVGFLLQIADLLLHP